MNVRRRPAWVLPSIAFGVALIWVHVRRWPGPDVCDLQYEAWRILEGARPYADVMDMNWPGVLFYGISKFVPGGWSVGFFLVDALLTALGTHFMAAWARRYWGPMAGVLAWILVPLCYVSHSTTYFAGEPDVWAARLVFPALACAERREGSHARAFQLATGVLLGLMVSLKPTMGLVAVALTLAEPWWSSGRAWSPSAGRVLLWAAAAIGTVVSSFLVVLSLGAPGSDLVDLAYRYNTTVQFEETFTLSFLARALWVQELARLRFCLPAALWGAISLTRSAPAAARTLGLLLLAGLGNYFVQGKPYGYHAGLLIDLVALLAAGGTARALVGLGAGIARSSGRTLPALTTVGHIVAVGAASLGATLWMARLAPLLLERPSRPPYDDQVARAVDDVRRLTEPGDPILGWQMTSGCLYFEAGRPAATRFFYSPLLANASTTLPFTAAWLQRFSADLLEKPPRAVLVDPEFQRAARNRGAPVAPLIDDLIQKYRPYRDYGSVRLYLAPNAP